MISLQILCLLSIVYAVPAPSFLDSVSDSYDKKYDDSGPMYLFNNIDTIRRSYGYSFEQPDGTKHEQEGEMLSKDAQEYLSVKSIISYVGKDGVQYTVKYSADGNGLKPLIKQALRGDLPDTLVASMLG